ncbi:Gfo/Idh/MocA family oxidoreductase [Bacillus thuringiensis]
MRVLIIGMGFSGKMFTEAFQSIASLYSKEITIAYTSRTKKDIELTYYSNVKESLEKFNPNIVVIAVNDENHGEILSMIEDYDGFVICEKPFVDPNFDLNSVGKLLQNVSGFCLHMVARYSNATRLLKTYVEEHGLKLVRANFLWEKNRINDYRPTTGVISEVIHSLDLVQWINHNSMLEFKKIQGVKSDFSISGDSIADSVAIIGEIDGAVITGYSSFVNLFRRRELDFVFLNNDDELIYAQLSFDTPNWYEDSLNIWKEVSGHKETLLEFNSLLQNYNGERKIERIVNVVKDVTNFVMLHEEPKYAFPSIEEAIHLQELLNEINMHTQRFCTVKYNSSESRVLLTEQSGFNRLG